ncbi:hypothetical protein TNCV_1263051 [Trichonephila clavipes]|nr:hypothetical protein TNCV_1263051 [Trichonephila clavipes]
MNEGKFVLGTFRSKRMRVPDDRFGVILAFVRNGRYSERTFLPSDYCALSGSGLFSKFLKSKKGACSGVIIDT